MLTLPDSARSSPFQAVVLVALIHLGMGAIIATSRRYGFGSQANLIADSFYLCCGLLLVERRAITVVRLRTAGLRGGASSIVLGLLCGVTAFCLALWELSQDGVPTMNSLPAADLLHAVLFAPVAEEMLFTGFLFVALRARTSLPISAWIVALLFTIGHLPPDWGSFGVRILYMIASCLLYERFRSLPLNMGMHGLMNGFLALAGQLPWLYEPVVLHAQGSLPYLAAASTTATLVVLLKITRRAPSSASQHLVPPLA